MRITVATSLIIFFLLSAVLVTVSGAPLKVHLMDIGCFFLAFVVGGVFAESQRSIKTKFIIWCSVGLLGLLIFDLLSAQLITKRELFWGWYFLYPFGLLGLVVLQLIVFFITKYWSNSKKETKKRMQISAAFGSAVGIIIAFVMMYIAWQHNPQQEFHSENGINWSNWLPIGVSWLLVVTCVVFIFTFVLVSIIRGIFNKSILDEEPK